jgi:hypothetical protein
MQDALERGDNIELRGFGTFGVRRASGYRGRNPRSGQTVEVRSRRMPYFKIGRPLRGRIEGVRPTVTPVTPMAHNGTVATVATVTAATPVVTNGQSHGPNGHGKAAVPLAARRAAE